MFRYWSSSSSHKGISLEKESKDELIHNTTTFPKRSNQFLNEEIYRIGFLIYQKCLSESYYGKSTLKITLDEIQELYRSNLIDFKKSEQIVSMFDTIIERTPTKFKNALKMFFTSADYICSWNQEDLFFIRWHEDIQINDQEILLNLETEE